MTPTRQLSLVLLLAAALRLLFTHPTVASAITLWMFGAKP
jgi:hypothetical protein